MAPKIPSVISCSSRAILEYELGEVRAGLELTETEESWNKISNALLRLNALAVGSAADFPSQLIIAFKSFARPIINSLNSERSRLSGCATDVLTTLATHLRRPFEALIPLFVPTLLSLASRSNKVFIARAKACLLAIVENVQSPIIFPLLRHAVSDKSVNLRLTATDLVVACLNCYNPPDLETPNRAEDIEAVIRATARDASADVRKSSRKSFEAYKILFPSRLDSFIAPLTPTMKKYLNIKAAPAGQRKPLLLSASTSAPTLPPTSKAVDIMTHSHPSTQGHAKSSSTSSIPTERAEKVIKSTKSSAAAPAKESNSMPPPPQRIPSSGPIRPPPSVCQAMAAAPSFPTRRTLLSRQALKATTQNTMDLSKSQSLSNSGAQRPEMAPTPPGPSSALDVVEPVSKPQVVDSSTTENLKTGPRRIPKPAPESDFSVSETKRQNNLKESLKERDREKARLASSASSSTSTTTDATGLARSRPPSQFLYSTSSKTDEEKEKGIRSRSASRTDGEFRPRPSSRMDDKASRTAGPEPIREPQVRPASRAGGEFRPRPTSRVDTLTNETAYGQAHARPPSRANGDIPRPVSQAEKRTHTKLEPRADHLKAERPSKRLKEERQHSHSSSHPANPIQHEEPQRRSKKDKEETRASKSIKESKSGRSKQEKRKRRAENLELPVQPELGGQYQTQNPTESNEEPPFADAPKEGTSRPKPATLEEHVEQNISENHSASEPQSAPLFESLTVEQESARDISSKDNDAPIDTDLPSSVQQGLVSENPKPPNEADIAEDIQTPKAKPPTTPPPKRQGGDQGKYAGVKPLVIHKGKAGPSTVRSESPESDQLAASDVPLPPSPPYRLPNFELATPAPLRQATATAAHRYQVAATPISKLLVSIQKGFDNMDRSVIGEESEGDVMLSGLLPSRSRTQNVLQGVLEEDEEEQAVQKGDMLVPEINDAELEEVKFFVDTRPRKDFGKREQTQTAVEERTPLAPRVENC